MREVAWNSISIVNMNCEEKKRVFSEILILKNLKHENILKIYSVWYNKDKKEVVFITKYMMGGSLKSFMQKYKPFKEKHIKNWCIQILNGLEYLHENKIIHRDLKLENIFICSETSDICIGDFGLSTNSTSKTKSCIGTPEIMAPEIYSGEYDDKIDLYAFGMCLLEMYTIENPYSECNNICQIYKRVINGILPLSINKICNLDIKNLIIQLLGDKNTRPSVKELLQNELFIQNKLTVIDYDIQKNNLMSIKIQYKNVNYNLTIDIKNVKNDILPEECIEQIREFVKNKCYFDYDTAI